MFSSRVQLHLCTTLALLGVALYTFFYFKFHLDGSLLDIPETGSVDSNATSDLDLAFVLNPAAHINRAPKSLYFHWNITSGFRAPDGVTKLVYLINGKFPGPLIEARSGDELVIDVFNGLADDEGTSIHWHGLSLRGANDMDGVVGLTQSSISPTETFTYRFTIEDNQSGTFWYHAHSGLQRADGLYGPTIIHSPAATGVSEIKHHEYDQDLVLMVGDWYHRSAQAVLDYYRDWNNFKIEPAPDSILLNGKGSFDCSMAVPARPVECVETLVPRLKLQSPRSRLRVINTGSLTGFSVSMAGYEMSVLELDGGNSVSNISRSASVGVLYPGERMDLIVQNLGVAHNESELIITLDPENLKFKNFALRPSQNFPILSSNTQQEAHHHVEKEDSRVAYISLSSLSGPELWEHHAMSVKAEQTLLFYTKISVLAEFHNRPKGFINRTSWEFSEGSSEPLIHLQRENWKSTHFVPQITSGSDQWVDVVLNNMDDKGHPFHLHGYSFYILSSHQGRLSFYDAYNPFDPAKAPAGGPMNVYNPVEKDTVYVPAMGYVVLRFKADNEGLWLFHCHVLWHHSVGMAMAFQVG